VSLFVLQQFLLNILLQCLFLSFSSVGQCLITVFLYVLQQCLPDSCYVVSLCPRAVLASVLLSVSQCSTAVFSRVLLQCHPMSYSSACQCSFKCISVFYSSLFQSPIIVSPYVLQQCLPVPITVSLYVLQQCLPVSYFSVYLCPTAGFDSILLHLFSV